jgi:hypothetical protein
MSKKKKVTAPLSYDPGKGRPKEYLAYLNWQEMQALQRLNGGNMERGPMGLPSFPPDWRGSEDSTGNWSGAGGTSPGGTQGGGSDSGSRGSESSPSGSDSADAAKTAESQQQAADAAAQQEAANKNAAEAAKTSAFAEDARKAGIGSLNVGPMQTPVKIGGGAISQAASAYSTPYSGVTPTMPGGGGMGQYNARRGSSVLAAGPNSGSDAFGNIAQGSIRGVPPSAARSYDALESDLTKRALSKVYGGEEGRTGPMQNAPSGVFGPRLNAGIPSYLGTASMPGMITTGMPSGYSGVVRDRNTTVAYKTPESAVETAENVTNVFKTPPPADSISEMTDYVETPFETNVPYTPYRPTFAAGTYTTPYNPDSPISAAEQAAIDRQYQYMGISAPGYDLPNNYNTDQETLDRLAGVYEGSGFGQEPPYEGVAATVIPSKYNYPVKPDGTPYTAEDIANLPPEIQKAHYEALMAERMGRVPYNLTEEQRQKMAVAKGVGRVINYSPITRGFVGITKLAGAGLGALPGAVGEFGEGLAEAGRQIGSPGEAVEDYETASPLKQVQMEVLAGRPNRMPGTSFARAGEQYAGGIPVQELGGKSDPYSRTSSRPSYSPSGGPISAASDTGRSQQYYLWDLGVGIPSPGEPEYNDYQRYLRERGASAEV